jgi:hypothetical protein
MITELKQDVGRSELVIEDGRITIEDDGSASVYLKQTEYTPLSQDEKAAELIISTANGKATVALSSVDVDAIADAIHQIQNDDR